MTNTTNDLDGLLSQPFALAITFEPDEGDRLVWHAGVDEYALIWDIKEKAMRVFGLVGEPTHYRLRIHTTNLPNNETVQGAIKLVGVKECEAMLARLGAIPIRLEALPIARPGTRPS